MARPHTGRCKTLYARYPGSRLRNGVPAAHVRSRLVLLGSPPDTVHGRTLRRTDPSSLLSWVRRHRTLPRAGIRPCCSGLQVQGSAASPVSAALPQTGTCLLARKSDTKALYIISANLSTGNAYFSLGGKIHPLPSGIFAPIFKKGLYTPENC